MISGFTEAMDAIVEATGVRRSLVENICRSVYRALMPLIPMGRKKTPVSYGHFNTMLFCTLAMAQAGGSAANAIQVMQRLSGMRAGSNDEPRIWLDECSNGSEKSGASGAFLKFGERALEDLDFCGKFTDLGLEIHGSEVIGYVSWKYDDRAYFYSDPAARRRDIFIDVRVPSGFFKRVRSV
jgi:hypothetical protein